MLNIIQLNNVVVQTDIKNVSPRDNVMPKIFQIQYHYSFFFYENRSFKKL